MRASETTEARKNPEGEDEGEQYDAHESALETVRIQKGRPATNSLHSIQTLLFRKREGGPSKDECRENIILTDRSHNFHRGREF